MADYQIMTENVKEKRPVKWPILIIALIGASAIIALGLILGNQFGREVDGIHREIATDPRYNPSYQSGNVYVGSDETNTSPESTTTDDDELAEYEKEKQIYEEAGIELTFDDWKNHSGSKENNLKDSVNKLLHDRYEEYGLVDTDYDGLIQMIYYHVNRMRKFIDEDYLGWPKNIYGDTYDNVREYIGDILGSFTSGGEVPNILYEEQTTESLQSEVLYCILHSCQYKTGYSNHPRSPYTLRTWMKQGHPDIGKIYSMNVEPCEKDFGDYFSCMLATVNAENGVFKIYIFDQSDDINGASYLILDIERGN